MWPFKNKIKKPEPKVETWKVPKDHAEKFCELYDRMMSEKSGKLEVLQFWRFVASIAAEEHEGKGATVIFPDHRPALLVVEKINDKLRDGATERRPSSQET